MGSRLILVLGYVFPCAGRVHLEYLLESKSCHQRFRSFSVINGFAFYPGYLRIPRTSWILMGHLERKGVRRCNIDISLLALRSHLRWVPAPHLEYITIVHHQLFVARKMAPQLGTEKSTRSRKFNPKGTQNEKANST